MRREEGDGARLAEGVELEYGRDTLVGLLGGEAEAVEQPGRQHVQRHGRGVDGLQPQPRGLVERVARLHRGAHVGHVDVELARAEVDREGVVAEVG